MSDEERTKLEDIIKGLNTKIEEMKLELEKAHEEIASHLNHGSRCAGCKDVIMACSTCGGGKP